MKSITSILLVPSLLRGNGSGHITRCFDLAKRLGAMAAVYLPDRPGQGERGHAELQLAFPDDFGSVRVLNSLQGRRFSLIVLDRRDTSLEELSFWETYGPVAALDEGGEARAFADYLIDVLPRVGQDEAAGRTGYRHAGEDRANKTERGFLSLPKKRRKEAPRRAERVLVSFGGEDPAGLTERFLALAVDSGRLPAESVTVVSGALARQPALNAPETLSTENAKRAGMTMLGPVQDLKERLHGYDLVVTQFGLTAYEAAWAGCAVLLLNPSHYHGELARAAGFPALSAENADAGAELDAALASISVLAARCALLAPAKLEDLAVFLANLEPAHRGPCPGCGAKPSAVIFRAERKSYRRCASCGLVNMSYFFKRQNPYTESAYFFDDYKAQYGRTYLEDLPKLRRMASERLDRIEKCLPGAAEPRVLDVGCAYGAFLSEAHSRGWHAVGSDLSAEAVDYVRATLHIPAFVADFSASANDGFYPRNLDCLSMWYVIEHFDELAKIMRRARALLKEGGVFAFSTPSCAGISARARPADFWERSPDDHFTVWNPASARRILKTWGFDVQSIRVTGHHPERFPGVPNDVRSPSFKAAGFVSRLFKLGDTFECYAVKRGAN
jgi:2-polyprenyl-3-methyl-5-hydroxy-6-metoxy-1,4-benzoquinol methylase/spore coat polysaccharide biosynthesis predicted glycosyltransferase SpsG